MPENVIDGDFVLIRTPTIEKFYFKLFYKMTAVKQLEGTAYVQYETKNGINQCHVLIVLVKRQEQGT